MFSPRRVVNFAAVGAAWVLSAAAFAQGTSVEIEHIPVRTAVANQPIRIEARVRVPEEEIRFFRVYYRDRGAASYTFVELYRRGDVYEADIPAADVTDAGLEYFLLLAFTNGDLVTDPRYDAHRSPYVVEVRPAEAKPEKPEAGPEEPLLVLSPEPGEALPAEELVVAVSFVQPDSVDSSSVRLLVDGKDVTAEAEISAYLLTWTPVAPLAPGRHVVTLHARSRSGAALEPLEFSFRILGDAERKAPIVQDFHGRLYGETRQERVARKNYATNIVAGRASGKAGPVKFLGDVYITSLERSDQQPRNRMRLAFHTRYLGVELGDTYPRYTQLTLWGQRVRGVSAYLHLGFFNVDFTLGELARAVEGVTTPASGALFLTSFRVVNGDTLVILRPGTYRRRLWAVRPSFGSGKHFQFGFTFVKVLDDTNSIRFGIKPKDNLVFGPDFTLNIGRGLFRLSGSAAFSLMTDDILGGPVTKSEVDSLFKRDIPIDPQQYSQYLIINENTVPLDPTALTSLAYELRATARLWRNYLQAGYRYVGPEYWTLANPFLRRNIRGFYVDDRIRLFGNQLYLNLRYDDYEDSFSDSDDLPTVNLRTFSYGFSFYPRQGLPQVSFSLRNHSRDNGLVDTTLVTGGYDPRVNNSSREAVFSVSQVFDAFQRPQRVSYSLSRGLRDDRFGGPLAGVTNTMHLLRWQSELTPRVQATLNFARTSNQSGSGDVVNAFRYSLLSAGVQLRFLDGHLRARMDARTVSSETEFRSGAVSQSGTVRQTGLLLGLDFFMGRHRAYVDAGFTGVRSGGDFTANGGRYTDLFLRARYEFQW